MWIHPIFLFLYLNPFSVFPATSPISLQHSLSLLSSSSRLFLSVPQQEDGPTSRQATMVPLVIPVSVPVHRNQIDPQGGWAQGRLGQGERPAGQSDRKPSVIVARRRSLRNSMTESFGQVSSLKSWDLHWFDCHTLLVYNWSPFSQFESVVAASLLQVCKETHRELIYLEAPEENPVICRIHMPQWTVHKRHVCRCLRPHFLPTPRHLKRQVCGEL